jgi:hypothetical protein
LEPLALGWVYSLVARASWIVCDWIRFFDFAGARRTVWIGGWGVFAF